MRVAQKKLKNQNIKYDIKLIEIKIIYISYIY